MTCSARLPVYVLLIAAFIPDERLLGLVGVQGLTLLGLFLAGLGAGAVVALLVSRSRDRRQGQLPIVVELPPYRDFVRRAGTVIFAVSVALWFLVPFPRHEAPAGASPEDAAAAQLDRSYAGRMGQAIEPALEPLGYDWKIGVGLIASFAAREVFVGTMGVIYTVGGDVDEESAGLREAVRAAKDPDTGRPVYTLATVFSLLAFYVLALQGGATVAVVKREAGLGFALGQLLAFLVLAYAAALLTYQGLSLLGYGP